MPPAASRAATTVSHAHTLRRPARIAITVTLSASSKPTKAARLNSTREPHSHTGPVGVASESR